MFSIDFYGHTPQRFFQASTESRSRGRTIFTAVALSVSSPRYLQGSIKKSLWAILEKMQLPSQTRRRVLRGSLVDNSHNKSTNTRSRPRPIDNWFRFVSCFTNAHHVHTHTHTHTHTCSCGVSVSTQVHQYQLVLLDRAHLQNISAKTGKYCKRTQYN